MPNILNQIKKLPSCALFARQYSQASREKRWGIAFGIDAFFQPNSRVAIENYVSNQLRVYVWKALNGDFSAKSMFPSDLRLSIKAHLTEKYPEQRLTSKKLPLKTEKMLTTLPGQGDRFISAYEYLRARVRRVELSYVAGDLLTEDRLISHAMLIRRVLAEEGRVIIIKNVCGYDLSYLALRKMGLSPHEIRQIEFLDTFWDNNKTYALKDAIPYGTSQNFLLVDTNKKALSDASKYKFATSTPAELDTAVEAIFNIKEANFMIQF